ncbi:MAG: serine protease [Planctomycetota bacterium]
MRASFLVTLGLACCAAIAEEPPAAALEAQVQAIAESARARTVLVVGVVGTGSGAVITPRGRVITNAHVVAGARYAVCRWADGSERLMRRLGVDYGQDLALLEPAEAVTSALPCFPWRGDAPRAGTWVLGLGFPGGFRGDDWAVASLGRVVGQADQSRASGVFDYQGALQSDTPIFSGNSGGPLVDLEGRLIGLNGAADIQRAQALTIPEARIKARLPELEAGWILLPTGLRLHPERTPVLQAFYRATDGLARELPQRLSRQVQGQPEDAATPAAGDAEPFSPGLRELVAVAAATPRQRALRGLLGPAPRVAPGARAWAPVDPRHAVTLAGDLRVGARLEDAGRRFVVAALSPDDDLALLEVEGPPFAAVQLAPARPIGSLVQVLGASGPLGAGIVSSRARTVGAGFLRRLRGGGGGPLAGAVEGLRKLAERLRLAALAELLEQLDRAQQLREAFSGGTAARGYASVLSIDAPVDPAQLGGAVLDRAGRLVGVSVGIPHSGTTYVVPWTRIWRAFGPRLAPAPQERGALRLY